MSIQLGNMYKSRIRNRRYHPTAKADGLSRFCRKLLFILALFPIGLFARINQNGDFQVWNDESLWIDLTENSRLSLAAQFRYGDHASKLFLAYVQAIYIYKLTHWFALAPGYRQAKIRRMSINKWRNEYMPLLDILFFLPYAIYIEQRNRIEYKIREDLKNEWVYRNLIALTTRQSFTKLQIRPFISNEIFWRQRHGVNQDRLSAGIILQPNPVVQGSIYYMLRYVKPQDQWKYQNILGLNLAIPF